MASSNSSTVLAILVCFFVITMLTSNLAEWKVNISCKGEVSYRTWTTPATTVTSSGRQVSVNNMWDHSQQTTPGFSTIGTGPSAPGLGTDPEYNVQPLTPECKGAIAGMDLITNIQLAFGSIILIYVVLHLIPIIGIGGE
jgi:hypothetical protein